MRLLTTQLTVQLTLSALSRRPFAERARKRELKKARKLAKEAFDLHLDWERRVRLDQPFTSISPSTRLKTASKIADRARTTEEEDEEEEGEGEMDDELRHRLDQPFRWGPEVRRDANGRVASPTASEIAGGCALDDTAEMMRADEEEGDDEEGEGESDEEEEDEAPMDAWFRRHRLNGGGGAGGGGGTCGGA